MTTARSPLSQLKAQADKIAKTLKAAERGEPMDIRFADKIEAARTGKAALDFVIMMDDKLLRIEMTWKTIADYSETALAAYILKQMRESREN